MYFFLFLPSTRSLTIRVHILPIAKSAPIHHYNIYNPHCIVSYIPLHRDRQYSQRKQTCSLWCKSHTYSPTINQIGVNHIIIKHGHFVLSGTMQIVSLIKIQVAGYWCINRGIDQCFGKLCGRCRLSCLINRSLVGCDVVSH